MLYENRTMVDRYEQVMLYTPAEFRRRIDGICSLMRGKNVDTLFFPECAEEAYDEWLLGKRMLEYMIVRADGTAVGVMWNETGIADTLLETPDPRRYVAMGHDSVAVCDGIRFVDRVSAEKLADLLAAGTPARIGLVLPEQMPALLADAIARVLPRAELVDMTIPVALFRAVKSEEELYVIRQAVNIQKAVFEAMPQLMRPGRRVNDINDEMSYLLMQMGASGVVHASLICNGQQDVPSQGFGGDPDHVVTPGDRFFALMEAAGPGHHHAAFGRHFVIGDLDPAWEKCVADAVRVHQYAVDLMKPDSLTLAQIAVRTRKYSNRLGYTMRESVGWNWMHSMGGYYYEQYSLEDYTEDIPLEENILLHCHPVIYREFPGGLREDLFILNTYLVTRDGAQDLVGIPMELKSLY